ncbi:MAG: efflux RND transporter periplasmic adaptor subunit, partial [Verrucomicrobia bacterium]|nr:efflux RND transporter periplasmic adaptor subunit [Verrucomicrobiota bacterium]
QGGRGGPGGPAPVVAGTVEKKDVPIYLNGIGTVQAYNTDVVHPQISGYLVSVKFREGQDVKKGDVLGVIDPRPYQAQLDQAVARKNADVAQLNNAKVLLDRDTDLFKKGVLDHQTYDTQRFLVDQLDATVKGDQANIDNAQTQLSYTQVTAPLDGRCGIRQTDEGNLVNPGSTLVTITQLQPISVIFTLPQQYVGRINQAFAKEPLKVIALDETQSQQLEDDGTLVVVNNQIDTTTGTVQLKANFNNAHYQLWPGQFVNTRLLVETKKDGLVVPASVVQRGPNGTFAYVITKDKRAEMRPVEVGQIDGEQALINKGLQEGEQVVVDGQYKLEPNMKVEIVPANSQAAKTLAQNERNAGSDQQQQQQQQQGETRVAGNQNESQPGAAGPGRRSGRESGGAGNDQQVAANSQAPAPQQTPNPGQLETYQAQNTGRSPVAAGTPNPSQQNQRDNNEQPNQSGGAHRHFH